MEEVLAFLQTNWHWILIGIVALILILKFIPRYKIAPPDTALIISGLLRRNYKVRNADGTVSTKKFGYRIVRGGATFWIPAVQRIDKLDLCLTQVDIKTAQPVPTKEYISVLVDAVANIKIGSDDLSIATAAEQLLHYDSEQIKMLAKDVLEGNMREIIGQMTIAELVQNRDKFAQESISAAMSDMSNMGLEIINLTIQNFSDKDGNVIDTMAARNIASKEQDKRIAEAAAEKESKFAEMQAEAEIARQSRDVEVQKAQAEAEIARQSRDVEVQKAAFKQETEEARAKAEMAYKIEQERINKTFATEHAAAEMTRLEKLTELKRQEVEIEREKLNVEIREKAQAEKDRIMAEAEAEKFRRQAAADAELYAAQKEAEAIRMKGEAEAEAMRKKAEAMQLYGQAAMMEMVTDKLPDIARAVSEPLSKTDKIILFGEGGATSMARDTAGTMLQTFEAVKEAVGLDIPKTIRNVTTGGLIGKAAADEAEKEDKEKKEEEKETEE